jgi:hypothetical protein
MTTKPAENVIQLPCRRLTEAQVQQVSYALQDASLLIERLAKKGRISQRDADVLNALSRAGAVFNVVLPRWE